LGINYRGRLKISVGSGKEGDNFVRWEWDVREGGRLG
jgi:hypothetical protein